MSSKPFLDYYTQNNISPVSQNISNLDVHFNRRDALYRQLGIVPSFVSGKKVIEFGCGSGYNSLHTLHLEPAHYVLVDGNNVGLNHAKNLLASSQPQNTKLDFHSTEFNNFRTSEKFDLVLCEGFIPLQLDPIALVKDLSRYVAKGGVLVVTCIDSVSYLPDLVRRTIGQAIVDSSLPLQEQANYLAKVYEPHFKSLPNMSRPITDWVLDNVLHPFFGKLFSIGDAITALSQNFIIHGSSPHFICDWKWYKDITNPYLINEYASTTWQANIHNFLDHSCLYPERAVQDNIQLLHFANEFVEECFNFYKNRDPAKLIRMNKALNSLASNLAKDPGENVTIKKLQDGANALLAVSQNNCFPDFGSFTSLFGRGQQYLSFIRVNNA